MFRFTLFGIVLSLWISTICSQEQNVMSIQWPVGLCKAKEKDLNQCNIPKTDIWTIHGLWPKHNSNPSREQFDISSVSHITDQLDQFWPDVLNKRTNKNFWKYEWTKHGRHLNFVQDNHVSEYFEKALLIYDNVSLILNNISDLFGFEPSNKLYSKKYIEKKLSEAFSAKIVLHCMECTDDCNKNLQCLVEVRICYDEDIKNPINCYSSSNCDKSVTIYPRKPPRHEIEDDLTTQYLCNDNNKAILSLPLNHFIVITICWLNIFYFT
ncbi:ribonuclease T2-like [Aethina tumida]|uniref:ribonuclease T2-like n=1 Tax=Aethina tumida TaxID=116153 RepID=UPI00214985C1|nr:ribonuclease T2-like [Aethina tumida]